MRRQGQKSNRRNDPFMNAARINLCGRCLNDYRETGDYLLRRTQDTTTDTCLFCNVRLGFEYFIVSMNGLTD